MMTAFLFPLRAIAGTCPLAGGKAVFEARAMLYMYEATEYNDKAICDAVDMVYALTSKPNHPNFAITPNPSLGAFNVSVPKDSKLLSIEISNSKGQIVWSKQDGAWTSKALIETELPSGIYFVRLVTDNLPLQVEKLVIIGD